MIWQGAKASDNFEDGHGPGTVEYGLHKAGVALIQDADLIGPSHAEQSAVDHASGVENHLTHDLFV
jgi:hypothetical protein